MRQTTNTARTIAAAIAGIVIIAAPTFAGDKMMDGKMSGGKMMGGKMDGKMSGKKMADPDMKMMHTAMSKMSAADKKTMMGMSKAEKNAVARMMNSMGSKMAKM